MGSGQIRPTLLRSFQNVHVIMRKDPKNVAIVTSDAMPVAKSELPIAAIQRSIESLRIPCPATEAPGSKTSKAGKRFDCNHLAQGLTNCGRISTSEHARLPTS